MEVQKTKITKIDFQFGVYLQQVLAETSPELKFGEDADDEERGDWCQIFIEEVSEQPSMVPSWLINLASLVGIRVPRTIMISEPLKVAAFNSQTTLTVEKPWIKVTVYDEAYFELFEGILKDCEQIYDQDSRGFDAALRLKVTEIISRKGKPKEDFVYQSQSETTDQPGEVTDGELSFQASQ